MRLRFKPAGTLVTLASKKSQKLSSEIDFLVPLGLTIDRKNLKDFNVKKVEKCTTHTSKDRKLRRYLRTLKPRFCCSDKQPKLLGAIKGWSGGPVP